MAALLLPVCAVMAVEPFDFRQTKWGFSRDQVIAAEGAPLRYAKDDVLLYRTRLAESPALVSFEFAAAKLWQASYVLAQRFSEPAQYLVTAEVWKKGLVEKYGEGKPDAVWLNSLFRSEPQKHGLAVVAGHVRFSHTWETPTTKILLLVSGGESTASVTINYVSKELESMAQSEEKHKRKSQF